jgi:MFS family permease
VGLLVDITPLRVSPDFRRLWFGQALSLVGSTMTSAALPFQVFQLTDSSLAVGLLGLCQLGPLLLFSVVGGALADSWDKRRMLLGVSVVALVGAGALSFNASLDDPHLWVLYVVGAAISGTLAVGHPVMRSMLPLLLSEEHRPAGFALQSSYVWLGVMLGPAIGGLVIAASGLSTVYALDVVSYVLALVILARVAPSPPVEDAPKAGVASILDGVRFLRGSLVIHVFALDLIAMVFGMPVALFPALADRLDGGPTLYGLLLSSIAAGGFAASLFSGWTSRVVHQGRAILVGVAVWGAAIAVAGSSRTPAVVLVAFAVAGGADMFSGVFRGTIAAALTPDDFRGRVSGVELAVYAGGPKLGDVEAGVVGGLVSVPFAIVSGGLVCVLAAAVFAAAVPRLTRYSTEERLTPAP